MFSTYGVAQITKGSGSDNTDSRVRFDLARESLGQRGIRIARAAIEGRRAESEGRFLQDQNTEGTGGFDNGRYGTGAGHNKK